MIWSSLVVAILIVGLVLVTYALLGKAVEARQDVVARQEALARKELEAEGWNTALSHFRHNLRDLLDGVGQARQLALLSLDRDQPAQAVAALELVAEAVATSSRFVSDFRPGEEGQEKPTMVDLGVLTAGLARLIGDETHEVAVSQDLRGWLVTAPPMTLAVLVGTLVRNAVEAATEVRLGRHGEALSVENPVGPTELELLRDGTPYELGVSTKGEGHGIGLDSARKLAARCDAALDHELFLRDEEDWVRFSLTFAEPEEEGAS